MLVADLEARLRALGWVPVDGCSSVRVRAWRHGYDLRSEPDLIRVPRMLSLSRARAEQMLARAIRITWR